MSPSKRTINRLSFFIGLACFLCICAFSSSPQAGGPRVQIKGEWFYVDGEKFFIKGVGYSPYRPGQMPCDAPELSLVENDLRLIKEAGFNTIRAWSRLSPDVLALAQKYGLMVIQGTDINLDQAIVNPNYLGRLLKQAEQEIKESSSSDNILFYLFANEIPAEKIFADSPRKAEKILEDFKKGLRSAGFDAPISISNSPQLDFMDNSFWDAASFNVYIFMPAAVFNAIGYRTYLEWLKEKHDVTRPLVITEYGLSVSKAVFCTPPRGAIFRFGGNSLAQQKDGTIFMLDEIVASGAAGACVFEWIDEWWKNCETPDDAKVHDDEAEEWFGLLAIEDESSDPKGTPRPVYHALKEYNQAILIQPKDMDYYAGLIPVEVYATDNIEQAWYRVNEGSWKKLKKSGKHWFTGAHREGFFAKEGERLIQVKAKGKDGRMYERSARAWAVSKKRLLKKPLNIKISTDKQRYKVWESVKIKVQAFDEEGKPVKDLKIDFAVFEPQTWIQTQGSKVTDKNGVAIIKYASSRPGIISIAAGALYKDGDYKRKFGDMTTIQVYKNGN